MKKGLELIKDVDDCVLEEGKMAFWWLGQSGYVIKIGKTVVYLDAFLSERTDRNFAPLLKPQEVANADIILGTHDHADHIDRGVWHRLSISSPNAKFIVPKLLIESLSKDLNIPEDRFSGLDDGISVSEAGLKITGIASAHEFLNQDSKTGSYPYLGYIIGGNGCNLYHSGDTCLYEGIYSKLRKYGNLDVMFIPINGRDAVRYNRNCIGNMTYQEAVDLAGNLKPRLVVPGHYEMFSLNSEDPLLFKDYIETKYPEVDYWIGNHGDMILVQHK